MTFTKGLNFVLDNKLTVKELEVYTQLHLENQSAGDLAEKLGKPKTTVHNLISRLRIKNLVQMKSKDSDGNMIYGPVNEDEDVEVTTEE